MCVSAQPHSSLQYKDLKIVLGKQNFKNETSVLSHAAWEACLEQN